MRRRLLLAAVPAALSLGLLAPATGEALTWGSDLKASPALTTGANVDAAYWNASVPGAKVRAPRAGRITRVRLKGRRVSGEARILFQRLRPIGGGRVRVVTTTQVFRLPTTGGVHTFRPTNFFVKKGDYVGLATIGGRYEVLAGTTGATTRGFVGAGKDMNGDRLRGRARTSSELLMQIVQR